jgi:hypothetical protein
MIRNGVARFNISNFELTTKGFRHIGELFINYFVKNMLNVEITGEVMGEETRKGEYQGKQYAVRELFLFEPKARQIATIQLLTDRKVYKKGEVVKFLGSIDVRQFGNEKKYIIKVK